MGVLSCGALTTRREFAALMAAFAASSMMPLRAQVKAKGMTFEVFSIRPSDPNARFGGFMTTPDGVTGKAMTMRALIGEAYWPTWQAGFQDFSNVPAWVRTDTFDVAGKVAAEDVAAWQAVKQDGRTKPLVESALQAALAERCGLVVHRVPKEIPSFELGV